MRAEDSTLEDSAPDKVTPSVSIPDDLFLLRKPLRRGKERKKTKSFVISTNRGKKKIEF